MPMKQILSVLTVSVAVGFGLQIMAPAATPRDIVGKLNAEILKAMNEPEQRNLLIAQGLTPRGSTPAELGAATREQLAKYQRLMRAANITAE